MAYKNDTYYEISSFGDDAIQASEALLKSYPLTRICLDILGKELVTAPTYSTGQCTPYDKHIAKGRLA